MKKIFSTLIALCAMGISSMAQDVVLSWPMQDKDNPTKKTATGDEKLLEHISYECTIGKNLTITGTEATATGGSERFIKLQPGTQVSSRTNDQSVKYVITPQEGHRFYPTKLSVDLTRFGTDLGSTDICIQISGENMVVLVAGEKVGRNSNDPSYTNYTLDLSNYEPTEDGKNVTISIFTYGIANNKQWGIRNVSIEGNVDKGVSQLNAFVDNMTCSAGDIWSIAQSLKHTQTVEFPTRLTSIPTDFAITAKEGYSASCEYVNQNLYITVKEGETVMSESKIHFNLAPEAYLKSATCSDGDILAALSKNKVNSSLDWAERLSAEPKDFAVEPVEGVDASINYSNKVAFIKATTAIDTATYTINFDIKPEAFIKSVSCSETGLQDIVMNSQNKQIARFGGITPIKGDPTNFSIESTDESRYKTEIRYENKIAYITAKNAADESILFEMQVLFSITHLDLANRPEAKPLSRGLLPILINKGVYVSWAKLKTDGGDVEYKLYRDGIEIKESPFNYLTNVVDRQGTKDSKYSLEVYKAGELIAKQENVKVWEKQILNIPTQTPSDTNGTNATYTPNDCSVYDMDGDGEIEIICKWDPDNSKDAASSGYTGAVFIDCYKLDGTMLWRINLGKNIRAGAHYTQFLCYDLDGDGYGEMVCKTAPGTIDGEGNYVVMGNDDPKAVYVGSNGKIGSGPEYLTVFDGVTGAELATENYWPKYGDLSTAVWGDAKMNRTDRYLACLAFLDGKTPAFCMMRGYYAGGGVLACTYKDRKITEVWRKLSDKSGQDLWGEGAHSVAVGDVDDDGFDEIVFGSACIDHDGSTLYRTGMGHGDALHLGDFDFNNPGMEVYMAHEETGKETPWDSEMRDARTGAHLAGPVQTGGDTGRGLVADFDDTFDGGEFFDTSHAQMWSAGNVKVADNWHVGTTTSSSVNFRIYWDADLLDEYHDRQHVDKWDSENKTWGRLATFWEMCNATAINYTKYNPNLQADMLGDWREEVIYYSSEDNSLNLIASTIPSEFSLESLREDHVYDMAIVWQNCCYNQPPHLSYNPLRMYTFSCSERFATFSAPYAQQRNAEVECYMADRFDGDTLRCRKISTSISPMPANMGYIIKKPKNVESYKIRPSSQKDEYDLSTNIIRGTGLYPETITAEEGMKLYTWDANGSEGVGFYYAEGTVTIPAQTAYLMLEADKATSDYYLVERRLQAPEVENDKENDKENAIKDIHSNRKDNAIYDLQGHRLNTAPEGMFIQNGKLKINRK